MSSTSTGSSDHLGTRSAVVFLFCLTLPLAVLPPTCIIMPTSPPHTSCQQRPLHATHPTPTSPPRTYGTVHHSRSGAVVRRPPPGFRSLCPEAGEGGGTHALLLPSPSPVGEAPQGRRRLPYLRSGVLNLVQAWFSHRLMPSWPTYSGQVRQQGRGGSPDPSPWDLPHHGPA